MEGIGGRRFVLVVATQALNAGLLVAGALTDGSYTAITLATTAAYIAANTYQKREQIRADAKDPGAPQA